MEWGTISYTFASVNYLCLCEIVWKFWYVLGYFYGHTDKFFVNLLCGWGFSDESQGGIRSMALHVPGLFFNPASVIWTKVLCMLKNKNKNKTKKATTTPPKKNPIKPKLKTYTYKKTNTETQQKKPQTKNHTKTKHKTPKKPKPTKQTFL